MASLGETTVKERRNHPRIGVMLPALLDQIPVTVTDISEAGIGSGNLKVMIDGDYGPSRGQTASLRFLTDDDFGESIEVEIVRVSTQRGEIGARYLNLNDEQKAFIRRLAAG